MYINKASLLKQSEEVFLFAVTWKTLISNIKKIYIRIFGLYLAYGFHSDIIYIVTYKFKQPYFCYIYRKIG